MSKLRQLRKAGHSAELEDLTLAVTVKPGTDWEIAEHWVKRNELELRAELVDEIRRHCGIRSLRRPDGTLPDVRGPDGEVVRGQVIVRIRVEETG